MKEVSYFNYKLSSLTRQNEAIAEGIIYLERIIISKKFLFQEAEAHLELFLKNWKIDVLITKI